MLEERRVILCEHSVMDWLKERYPELTEGEIVSRANDDFAVVLLEILEE